MEERFHETVALTLAVGAIGALIVLVLWVAVTSVA